jgi:hypothetical protein
MRQMIVNLPAHALHLQANHGRHFVLTRSLSAVSFLGQHSQRSFQSVGKVAGFGQRPPHDPLTVFQQGIEIVHQGLDFDWICSFDPAAGAIPQAQQLFAQTAKGQKAGAELQDASENE